MPKERNAFSLGLALIVFALLFVGVLIFLAPRGGGDLRLQVRFPIEQVTTSLQEGGEVFCGGSTVGSIRSVERREMVDDATGHQHYYTLVTITVDSEVGLRQDCRIVPEGLLLGGVGKLTIVSRGVGPAVERDQLIDGQPPDDLAAVTRTLASQLDLKDPTSLLAMIKTQLDAADARSLLGKIHAALDDVTSVTESLRHEFNPRERAALIAQLHSILDNANRVTGLLRDEMDSSVDEAMIGKLHVTLNTLNRGLESVAVLLEDNREPVTEAVGHIRETSRIIEQQIAARIAEQLDLANAAGLLAKVHVSVDRLGTSLDDVNEITGAGREVVLLNKEQIIRLIANAKETSDHLKAAIKELRQSPWRIMFPPSADESSQANIFSAARSFSEAAIRLDDAVIRLQALSETSGAAIERDDPVLLTILGELEQTFTDFTEAEGALWEQLEIK